jgi:hypothetical protein
MCDYFLSREGGGGVYGAEGLLPQVAAWLLLYLLSYVITRGVLY